MVASQKHFQPPLLVEGKILPPHHSVVQSLAGMLVRGGGGAFRFRDEGDGGSLALDFGLGGGRGGLLLGLALGGGIALGLALW